MDDVQVIPIFGSPLEFDSKESGRLCFPSSENGFLLGQENRILELLLQEIIDGTVHLQRQPILIYGLQGTGRTHILKGLLAAWRKNQPHKKKQQRQSHYSSCADFAKHLSDSISFRSADEFRRRYYRVQLLLLDDLEQLLGKPAAQTELRLLLDSFIKEGGIVVLTAQTLPEEIKTGIKTGKAESLAPELVVRIQGGTTIPLLPPGEAVRRQFIQNLVSALRIPVTEQILTAIAKQLTGTLPQLYGSVVQAFVEAKAADEPVDASFWNRFFKKQKVQKTQDMTDITKRTAKYFSLKIGDLKGSSRCKTVVLARSLAVYQAKMQLQLSYKEIGHFFEKRDSSTVRHLFEKVRDSLETDCKLRDHLFRLESMKEKNKRHR